MCRQNVPSVQLTQSRPNGWYRQSVPTVGKPTLHGTETESRQSLSSTRHRLECCSCRRSVYRQPTRSSIPSRPPSLSPKAQLLAAWRLSSISSGPCPDTPNLPPRRAKGTETTHNTPLVPPGVCGAWPLLAVWDPRFSRFTANPHLHKIASTQRGCR